MGQTDKYKEIEECSSQIDKKCCNEVSRKVDKSIVMKLVVKLIKSITVI